MERRDPVRVGGAERAGRHRGRRDRGPRRPVSAWTTSASPRSSRPTSAAERQEPVAEARVDEVETADEPDASRWRTADRAAEPAEQAEPHGPTRRVRLRRARRRRARGHRARRSRARGGAGGTGRRDRAPGQRRRRRRARDRQPAVDWATPGTRWPPRRRAPSAPEAPAAVAEEPTYDAPETVVARADEPASEEPEDDVADAPVRLQIRRPLSAAPAASALEGDFVPDAGRRRTSHDLRSSCARNWLNEDDEEREQLVDRDRGGPRLDRRGAGRGRRADTDGTTRTGLPVRRPGGRLVPGGVCRNPTKVVRDPEAIRNRLAAHAAGVSRGRAAAAAQPVSNDYAHEETGPA